MIKVRLYVANLIEKSWWKSFNNALLYNSVGLQCICQVFSRQYTQFLYKVFAGATESGGAMGGCNFENILPNNVPKCSGEKLYVFDTKPSSSSEFYFLKPGLYNSITDIVEAMNMLIQEGRNHTETSIAVKVSRRTQKVAMYLAIEGMGLAFLNSVSGHIFGSKVCNYYGVLLGGKGPHKPVSAYGIVRKESFMVYTDLVEYNNVGDTKALMLRCFLFISKLKFGDIITNGKYLNLNYQTIRNLQFRRLLKKTLHSIHIDLRGTSGEKRLLLFMSITRFVLMFIKAAYVHFQR